MRTGSRTHSKTPPVRPGPPVEQALGGCDRSAHASQTGAIARYGESGAATTLGGYRDHRVPLFDETGPVPKHTVRSALSPQVSAGSSLFSPHRSDSVARTFFSMFATSSLLLAVISSISRYWSARPL